MNKFVKLAIALGVVIALSITVYRVSKKGGHEMADSSPSGETSGASGDGESADEQASQSGDRDGDSASVGKGGDAASEDFMGGVTGRSAEGPFGKDSDDPNAVPREDGIGKTAGGADGASGAAKGMGATPGSSGTNVPGMAATKPDSNCFSFEYKHQKEALDKDIEDFLDYSNAFPILHDKVATKSICVKVNGKAVAHKVSKYKNQQEVVIGSVVGPESVIKVSYCVGKATCKESCAIKTNRFMDDLMSDTGDEDEFKESWGDAKEQKRELAAKVKEFRNVASENRDLQKQSTIRNWETIQTNDWVCKK